MKKVTLLNLAVIAAYSAIANYEVVYENDFTARTSQSAVPTGQWRTQKYAVGLMANTDCSDPFGTAGGGQNIQDGWIKGASSGANARVWRDAGGNSMAVLGHASAAEIVAAADEGRIVLKQRIGNRFTSGVVTVQVDMRPPVSWQEFGEDFRGAAVCVGDEDFYSPDVEKSSTFSCIATTAGVWFDGASGCKVYYRDSAERKTGVAVTDGDWLRIVMSIDMDKREWGFSVYDMGAAHPSFSASTPATPVFAQSGMSFGDDSLSSVSSIAICGFGVCWNADGDLSAAPDSAACFDSVRIVHDDDECCLNDFGSCRRRSLAAGASTASYIADCIVTNAAGAETYPCPANSGSTGEALVPDKVGGDSAEPVGRDGWRRLFESSSYGTSAIQLRNESGNCCIRFDSSSRTGVAQPIGTTVSSGIVRLRLDMRVPSSWVDSGRLWVTLGNDTLYNGKEAACRAGRYLHAGISYRSTTTDGRVRYLDAGGGSQYTGDDGNECQIKMATWYRAEISANLDKGTYDYALYEQGSSIPAEDAPDGTKVFSVTGVGRMNGISEISTFAVWGFNAIAYYDNIRIWHTPSVGSEETLLYGNTFSKRIVCQPGRREGKLTGTVARAPEGQDGWTAAGVGMMSAYHSDGDNPALSFKNSGGSYGYAVHEIGRTLSKGVLVAQADVRPPRGWLGTDGSVYVRLGGDKHLLGSLNDQLQTLAVDEYRRMIAGGFGFKRLSGSKVAGIYTNVVLVAWQGNRTGGGSFTPASVAVDTTHWYRFVATMDIKESQYDLSVYDMGAAHPSLASSLPPEPVATFTALPFRQTTEALGGLSCFSVNASYTASSPLDDAIQPYVDNIRISRPRRGLLLMFR